MKPLWGGGRGIKFALCTQARPHTRKRKRKTKIKTKTKKQTKKKKNVLRIITNHHTRDYEKSKPVLKEKGRSLFNFLLQIQPLISGNILFGGKIWLPNRAELLFWGVFFFPFKRQIDIGIYFENL